MLAQKGPVGLLFPALFLVKLSDPFVLEISGVEGESLFK